MGDAASRPTGRGGEVSASFLAAMSAMDPWGEEGPLRDATVMSNDAYMAAFFEGALDVTSDLLSAIVRRRLEAVEVGVHHKVETLGGRVVEMDVLARDEQGALYDIEVQARAADAPPQRARMYASALDYTGARRGVGWEGLPESWVIFLCGGDALGRGLPIATAQRTIRENGEPLGDGSYVVYADMRAGQGTRAGRRLGTHAARRGTRYELLRA